MAQFHEEPTYDQTVSKAQSSKSLTEISNEPKVNPLAKNKSKKSSKNGGDSLNIEYVGQRKSSLSSEDIEVPNVMKITTSSTASNEEFDCWISDTNQRRSPEGGEDSSSMPTGHLEPIEKITEGNDKV